MEGRGASATTAVLAVLVAFLVVGCDASGPTERPPAMLPSETPRATPTPSTTPPPLPTPDMTGWQVVREDDWGYTIGMPEGWVIVANGVRPGQIRRLQEAHPRLARILDRVADDLGDASVRFAALAPDGSTVLLWRLDEDGLVETNGIDAYVAGQAGEIGQSIPVSVTADFHPRIHAQRIRDGSGEIDLVLVPRGRDVWQLEVLVETDAEAVGELLRAMLFRYEALSD